MKWRGMTQADGAHTQTLATRPLKIWRAHLDFLVDAVVANGQPRLDECELLRSRCHHVEGGGMNGERQLGLLAIGEREG